MKNQINSTKAVVTAVIFSISLMGLIPSAQAHDGNASATDVHACLGNKSGNTRIVSVDEDCRRKETATHWAIIGPAGADGADGAAGPTGPAGADGTNGIDGTGCSLSECIEPGEATLTCGTTWVNVPCIVLYDVGDTGPAGGIVFHVTNGGLNGLEAAPVDQASAQWCSVIIDIANVDNISSSATPDSNSGADNTPLIVAQCGSNSAAGIAANYVWPNGQTDGFLPNKEELNLLYNQRNVVGGFVNPYYWSSSESVANYAWVQLFSLGFQKVASRDETLVVRAVRAF